MVTTRNSNVVREHLPVDKYLDCVRRLEAVSNVGFVLGRIFIRVYATNFTRVNVPDTSLRTSITEIYSI